MFTDDRLSFSITVLTALVIMCLAALPLQMAMIMSGAKEECAVENMIHIYLIVAVATGLFAKRCSCGTRYQCKNQGEEKSVNPLKAVEQHFLFAWFICGKMWIYEKLKTELLRSRL